MISKIREAITLHNMILSGDSVAVGLSGGADSVSLLHALLDLQAKLKITVRAIHINHGIRGESADRDEQFCRELCERLCVPLECVRLDIPAIAAQRGIGLEECGRQCRYEQFIRIAREQGCVIATAHTLSDSMETVLFNLSRGSALSGVTGIPPVRRIDDDIRVIRPLIGVTRDEVERYCRECGVDYVTDETNTDTAFRRNLIRHQVIPALQQVNPSLHTAVKRFSLCARGDDDYLFQLAAEALEKAAVEDNRWLRIELDALPYPLLRRALVLIARTRGYTPTYAQVELCAEAIFNYSGAVVLTEGLRFVVNMDLVALDDGKSPPLPKLWGVWAQFPCTVLPDGRRLVFTEIDLDGTFATQKHQNLLFKNALSCGIIKDNVSVRNRREGDRFAPAGRGVTKKLKKLLCDEGVPLEKRDSLAIVVNNDGILWVEGFGASELRRPADNDRRAIVPVIEPKQE